jgi:beta-glucuronidase
LSEPESHGPVVHDESIRLQRRDAAQRQVAISIEELDSRRIIPTDAAGRATFEIEAKPQLWEPAAPKLYHMKISTRGDVIEDEIGFHSIEVRGGDLVLRRRPCCKK